MGLNRRFGQVLYGAFFTLLVPALFAAWASRLDRSGLALWAVPFPPAAGMALAAVGLALIAVSMAALWTHGKGLPMNAYPPERLVTRWTYAIVSHPIYAGFVLCVAGVAIAAASPAGLWMVTPIAALATWALVAGYEGPALQRRFPDAGDHTPWLTETLWRNTVLLRFSQGALLGWRRLVRVAERLGNSWRAIELGPMRIINHAAWSGSAAVLGVGVVIFIAGDEHLGRIALVFLAGLAAAGAWGYWLEGGSRLSRPFGYYGFLFGAAGMLGVIALGDSGTTQELLAAFAVAAPLAQAIGRVRCLVQGCCHGRAVTVAPGMRVTHVQSRIVALGGLRGVPVHPTPLYSIAGNVLIAIWLWLLMQSGAPAYVVAGLYLVLSSLARFVEEHYRGEPQTAHALGLSIYQWLAVALFFAGIGLSMIGGAPVTAQQSFSAAGVASALAAGAIAAFCMSVDFPHSNRRFSRLTVSAAR